jgi:hypothetical protein
LEPATDDFQLAKGRISQPIHTLFSKDFFHILFEGVRHLWIWKMRRSSYFTFGPTILDFKADSPIENLISSFLKIDRNIYGMKSLMLSLCQAHCEG